MSERCCQTCGKRIETASATVTECPSCEQWWKDNPPPMTQPGKLVVTQEAEACVSEILAVAQHAVAQSATRQEFVRRQIPLEITASFRLCYDNQGKGFWCIRIHLASPEREALCDIDMMTPTNLWSELIEPALKELIANSEGGDKGTAEQIE